MLHKATRPVLGFAAYSGTGKTTLLTRLIPALRARGLRVGMIKHAHHNFDVDKPGKDSYELRKAGASQMLVASSIRWALMVEQEMEKDPDLNELLGRLDQSNLDLVLVEGFKKVPFPKIELHRSALGQPLLHPNDPSVIAVATDTPLDPVPDRAQLDLDDVDAIAEFIVERFLSGAHSDQSSSESSS